MVDHPSVTPGTPDAPAPATEPTLVALLVSVARRATDAQAAVACAAGTLAAAIVLLLAPAWWPLAVASVSIACFGTWVVLERGASTSRWRPIAQRALVLVGVAGAFAVGLSLLTRMLGIWIS